MNPLMEKTIAEQPEEDDDDTEWYEWIPLGICLAVLLGIVIFMCVDWTGAVKIFTDIIDYTKENPYEAMGILIGVYILLIIFLMPLTFLHIMVAFAYCTVYDSYGKGFAFSTLVIFLGCVLGAILALFLGRLLFANYIKGGVKTLLTKTN